ncbi:MAG: hypothetical protein ACK4UN_13405, partial [Limisphaerales bacterium]
MNKGILLGLGLISASLLLNQLHAAENRWIQPSGGFWNNPANWSLGTIPGEMDDVVIDEPGDYIVEIVGSGIGNSLTLGGTSHGTKQLKVAGANYGLYISTLQIEPNGELLVSEGEVIFGEANVDGSVQWAGGLMHVFQSCTVTPSGTLSFVGSGESHLKGTILNEGTLIWESTGSLKGSSGNIDNAGRFLLLQNLSLTGNGSALNRGILEIPEGKEITLPPLPWDFNTYSLWEFNNKGTILVQSNASLELGNAIIALLDGTVLEGEGVARATEGSLRASGTISFNATFELDGGFLTGDHTLTGSGRFIWNGGGFWGGATVAANGFTIDVTSSDTVFVDFHVLTNLGTINWQGNATLNGHLSGFYNLGIVSLTSDCNLDGYGIFHNSGTIASTPNTTPTLRGNWAFDLINTGTFYAAANSSLNITEGFVQLDDGTLFAGPGITRLIDGYLGGSGNVVINDTVELAGSVFAGQHTIGGPGVLNWTKGGFGPYGETLLSSNFTVNATPTTGVVWIDHHTLTNAGTIYWNSEGNLYSSHGAFHNTGSLALSANCHLDGYGIFFNSGTIASTENAT